jgi:hypothetical protein
MYLVVWVAIDEDGSHRDIWVAHDDLKDAQTHYEELSNMDGVYTVSLCNIMKSTDYETNAI